MGSPLHMTPTVSVIAPIYNAEQYLGDLFSCLDSQTYENLDVILVDDGSTDSSLQLLKEAAKAHPEYRIISTENKGAGAARNAGLRVARGEYAICVDADDLFDSTFIEKMVNPFRHHPNVEVTICNLDDYFECDNTYHSAPWAIDRNHIPIGTPFHPAETPFIFSYVCGYATNKMVKMSLIRANQLSWQEVSMHEDMAFVQTALALAEEAFYVDEPLYHHRKRSSADSLSDLRQDTHYECLFLALEQIKNNLQQAGVWENYEKGFANYALSQCRWKYGRVSDETRESVGSALANTWFGRLGLSSHEPDLYLSNSDYQFMSALLTQTQEPYEEEQNPTARQVLSMVDAAKKLLRRIRKRLAE